MSIRVTCTCGRVLKAPSKMAGKTGRCPSCSRAVLIVGADDRASVQWVRGQCSKCGKWVKAPAAWAGQEGACPKCKAAVMLPALGDGPDDQEKDDEIQEMPSGGSAAQEEAAPTAARAGRRGGSELGAMAPPPRPVSAGFDAMPPAPKPISDGLPSNSGLVEIFADKAEGEDGEDLPEGRMVAPELATEDDSRQAAGDRLRKQRWGRLGKQKEQKQRALYRLRSSRGRAFFWLSIREKIRWYAEIYRLFAYYSPPISAAVLGVIMLLALWVSYGRFTAARKSQLTPMLPQYPVFYFDLGKQLLITGSNFDVPPIQSPLDAKQQAVRAYVFACGDCSNQLNRFAGWLQKYGPDSVDDRREYFRTANDGVLGKFKEDKEEMAEVGELISAPAPIRWAKGNSEAAFQIVQAAVQRCAGKEPIQECFPLPSEENAP